MLVQEKDKSSKPKASEKNSKGLNQGMRPILLNNSKGDAPAKSVPKKSVKPATFLLEFENEIRESGEVSNKKLAEIMIAGFRGLHEALVSPIQTRELPTCKQQKDNFYESLEKPESPSFKLLVEDLQTDPQMSQATRMSLWEDVERWRHVLKSDSNIVGEELGRVTESY